MTPDRPACVTGLRDLADFLDAQMSGIGLDEEVIIRAYRCCTCNGTGVDSLGDTCADCLGTGIDNHGA
ncbi:hypothetical protein GCM10009677_43410 [Sphaerisporangium rubeum]|uniref:Molecular chaperone DnaJ n=1 Tax=Sphaerisporangium rubeum TaxID=321317 RepID=A0A7X0IKL1_9ACTN|nr:hypothetical protein [Sphaerisporangium rubeum]MBB6476454.1 hypothetical protein [Sphaerisporangium rubeum]